MPWDKLRDSHDLTCGNPQASCRSQHFVLVEPQLHDLLVERTPRDPQRLRRGVLPALMDPDRLADQFAFKDCNGLKQRVRHVLANDTSDKALGLGIGIVGLEVDDGGETPRDMGEFEVSGPGLPELEQTDRRHLGDKLQAFMRFPQFVRRPRLPLLPRNPFGDVAEYGDDADLCVT